MATTLRSSTLPSRIRELLSGESIVGPSLKLESEPPPAIRGFIDKVIKSPLADIAIPLSGFRWEYNKGNFHHWRPLFLHFDTYFKSYLSGRQDLLLSDSITEDGGSFPKHAVLQILRVMQIILENCHNKSSFGGLEHFKLLLASTDPDILVATLETLSALVKISPSKLPVSGKLISCGAINSCLLSLAQGWGSKEEGLGLYSCVVANETIQEGGLCLFPSDIENENGKSQHRLGSTLYFEFHESADETNDGKRSSNLRVIHSADLHLHKEDDLLLLKQLVEQYHVPLEHRFSLLTRIRYACAFRSRRTCRLYSRICLLSFVVLAQSNDAHDELVSFFANEPEFTNELIRIVRSGDSVPATIKALAMLALGAQLAAYSSSHDRARILSGSSMVAIGENRDVLNVLQREVSLLKSSTDPSSLSFMESLLQFYLLHVISSSSSGSSIRGSGMVTALLPLLQDVCSTHMHLVGLAVKTLQKLMDYSNAAVTLFKDMGGIDLLSRRLQTEVNRVIGMTGASDTSMIAGELPRFDDDLLYSQKRLIKALLKALGSATYAPANSARSQNSLENSLPGSLSLIFQNVERFGGDIYFSAVTVMSEIIHKDPTCLPSLHELGLPEAFLSSVVAGILPSSKAIRCVPSGLGAICLNAKGLEAVKETTALRFLVEIFTTRKYVVAMNAGVVPLATGVEELLRHVSSLRGTGVDIIVEIIDKLTSLADESCSVPERGDGSVAMETESENKENEGISNECFIQLCIFHVMVLVHRTMESNETCRLFVEKKGIEVLMKLLLRPSIAQSTEGMSIAMHSTVVFKGFTQHHSAPLAQAFCSSLREHLKKVLSGFASASGSFLLAPKTTPDRGIFSSLFIVEFLLFLATSKENRWVTALLTEFGNGSKDVLEDIGRVHREVLWQVALLDDSKLEKEDSSSGSCSISEPQKPETTTANETEDRFNSVRQFLDPLLRRRLPGWSVESQFLDLINLYRDLGRAPGTQRLGTDGLSNPRLGAGHHRLHRSGSLDSTGAVSKLEHDDPRSYYLSCCDMMRSLSFHIRHLFLELGKVMLLPSRRRDDSLNVSPSSKSVVSTFSSIVLDHINFEGHTDPSRSEVSISTKCRYFGKVVDFVNGILLDKPESCNPILVNCFYGHGVFQAVLTTFEATSQLLFTVNRVPASPMDTDDGNSKQDEKEENDSSWIYGPLACYGTLMDHLVTSSFVFSPFTKHLLAQPLTNGNVPFPRDAETFIKVLQSMVLKSVLPIWNHPHFTDCSHEFIAKVISIIRHIYSGVEVKNVSGTSGARAPTPPLNESTISMIVEMGFSRLRAEEALRQVGRNRVDMAMEWLFSHPEEAPEDDELARALAMSLGNNSEASTTEDVAVSENITDQEEEILDLPPVDELLSTCMRLLPLKEPLAFPIRDLLVMICSQNDGECRLKVISFIIDHLKLCTSVLDSGKSTMLSSLFHVLALVLHEDAVAREIASKNGLIIIASDLLSQWELSSNSGVNSQVPKWVTVAFLAVDRLFQVDTKLNSEIIEKLKKNSELSSNAHETPIIINEEKPNKVQTLNVDGDEQKRLVEIACRCIKNQIPSETMHVVLQLCATLTRTHSVAVNFLDAGGLTSLLSLPTKSLFSGFDNVASTIIRHILEDPQTLQQAMESEIRHILVAATNRHANGRVTPRSFITTLASVISRDPVVFMQAAQSVCQIEMVGERPHVILLKDREKDKKDKVHEKDKQQPTDGKPPSGDPNLKNVKVHRKPPPSFTTVIELLLDMVVTFVPSSKDDGLIDEALRTSSLSDMEIDDPANKGKGKAIATVSEQSEVANDSENSASLAKTVFLLKLLNDILLTYSSSVHVLLRRDTEIGSFRGLPQRGPNGNCSGGIFHHILHKFLPYSGSCKKEKKIDGDWRQKLASRASQFLVAACVRSTEARKRNFSDINNVFNDFVESSDGFRSANCNIHAFIDLLNDIFVARSPTGSYISAEASATFIDGGLVRSLTRTLHVLDLDHVDSPKVVTGLVKVLELVTKEHVHSSDKVENLAKSRDSNLPGNDENTADRFPSLDITYQPDLNEVAADHIEPFNPTLNSGSSDSVTDDMEHDRDLDEGFAPGTEDDFMHEASEEATGLGDGIETVGIRFEIQHNGTDNHIEEDDDEEMSGDDGDDVDDEDDDDEEHHDLVEDEVRHHMHPDTDQEDHDIDEEEFDEDVLEEEDEDDEDDEDGVILRLEEGINGINVFDHIEVFGRENNFPNDTLHVMPVDVDVFGGSRRRTTSIYNILGRTGDHAAPSLHPLLSEPSSSAYRQPENAGDAIFSDRSLELDTIFRSLRNGRQHRLNIWADDAQLRAGSNGMTVPQGLEDLLVSQLRRPTTDKPNETNTVMREPEAKEDGNHLEIEAGVETLVENNVSGPDSELVAGNVNPDVRPEANDFLEGMEISNTQTQAVDSDIVVRDIEAISQESGGSGATLGESLRSLEVEIGSADGHDDGERQGSTDRLSLGDPARARRLNISLGNTLVTTNRDPSLQSVSEISEIPAQGVDESAPSEEQQNNNTVDSGSIDQAFLDALPEELRAEVLSAQRGQAAELSNAQPQSAGDIDPEFLAALPSDIRAEVLAQQQAQRLLQHQSQELEGQPVEMDTVSIIATFPSDLREEVLLTSSDAILANLTPALVAEANMLRERFAHRYHSRALFGMYPRHRRGESSRRSEGAGSSLDRGGGASNRSTGGKLIEAEGAPLVDTDALKSMIRLLRVVQPLYKGQFQRLLLNLCAHRETRAGLVQILMEMLMLDTRKAVNSLNWDGEPSYRLYASQNHVMYSRPQFSDGVPPLVSRRILETLSYLARNHSYVAKLFLQLEMPKLHDQESLVSEQSRGKEVMIIGDEIERTQTRKGDFSIILLLTLLKQPLYLRSIAHLEQLLNLLEVIIDNAESNSSTSSKPEISPTEEQSGPPAAISDAELNSDAGGSSTGDVKPCKTEEVSKPSTSGANKECDQSVLLSLPQTELRLLCSLLAQEGLSATAYALAGEVLKKLVSIAPTHCHLFISELADSVRNLTKSAMAELHIYGEAENALLSSTTTDGTAILRVLQALCSLVASLNKVENDTQQDGALSRVSEVNAALEPLWLELSTCISKIESYSDSTPVLPHMSSAISSTITSVMPPLPAGTQNILPYIESFFVTCEKLHPGLPSTSQEFAIAGTSDVEDGQLKTPGLSAKVDEKHVAFVKFSDKHRKLLNAFIRQNPGLLEKSFSLMLKVPRVIDFDNKRSHFRSKIKHQHDHHHSPLRISVRRAYILEDSYNQLRMRSTQDIKGRLTVHFQGEEGIDAGGLTREWYQLLSRVIFDKGALLFTTVGNDATFQPNPNSVYQTEHLSYFKFVGRVVGKALFDGQLLDVHFTRSFYKHILGVKVTYHDIEAIDPDYFKNLKWMLENDISDVLDLTFSMDADEEKLILYERAEVTDHELIPGGRNIRVTEENKHEYVDLVAEHRLTTAIRPQINAFLEGFTELIPRDLISIFNDKELELLISGLPDIDLDDMRANTEYSGYSAGSPVIQWFWEVVQGLSKEDKARLLQFVTGTSKVPLEGFSALQGISGSQRFQIHKAYGSPDHLPSAHTCFNQLDVPEYPSKEHLEERLLLAIHEANEGFGFG
ncbi:hypothetical protein GIB67_019593 [Kingdonia uniflora]|uniref:HECT-type E3 ubiquitin transferase n=1 Tax=Kingdonia uniflora TaxID=39325 RepID=A0A7J7N0J3_9MAGN|nr:hypothetical protein GIB67_019593 [Kingdonia uniflora]